MPTAADPRPIPGLGVALRGLGLTAGRPLGDARVIGRPSRDKEFRAWTRASAVGIEFSIAVVACLLFGWWLDGKLGTEPWLTLAGLGLGSLVGFRALWRVAQDSHTEED